MNGNLFGPRADEVLQESHYLGPSRRRQLTYHDDLGVMVFGSPASRQLPTDWLELTRWCITDRTANAGTRQFRACLLWLAAQPDSCIATTIVSYSDPSVGHDGALYRACGWLWAPTWHRLRTPPTGNGSWQAGKQEAVKDRWVYPLRPDQRRTSALRVRDESIERRMPWASYQEPKWKRGRVQLHTGGGDYQRWKAMQ